MFQVGIWIDRYRMAEEMAMLTRSRSGSIGRERQAFVHRRKHGLAIGVVKNHSTNEH